MARGEVPLHHPASPRQQNEAEIGHCFERGAVTRLLLEELFTVAAAESADVSTTPLRHPQRSSTRTSYLSHRRTQSGSDVAGDRGRGDASALGGH
jgi:hypothetical protein